jgi:hypothetical protein
MTSPSLHITDIELLTYIGFRKASEHEIILAFAAEQGMSVKAVLAQAMRHHHTQSVIGPEHVLIDPFLWPKLLPEPRPGDPDYRAYGCPALD